MDQAEVEELLRRILAEASAAREDIHVDPGELEIEIEKFLEAKKHKMPDTATSMGSFVMSDSIMSSCGTDADAIAAFFLFP